MCVNRHRVSFSSTGLKKNCITWQFPNFGNNLISLSIEPCNNISYLKVKVKWLLSILWLTWNWKWFPICFLIFGSNICDIGAVLVQLIDNTALRISFSVDFRSRCLSKGLNQQIIIHRVRLQFKENMKK